MTSSDDQPTSAMTVVAPGRVLAARYELVSLLGSGGMARVFLARDQVLQRDVAVKVLREPFASDPAFLARFTREALHAAGLSHPGVVTIFDAGVDQGTAYLVMELVHGRTVQQVLADDGQLPIGRSVRIAADVCEVLEVAHRAGVVHRDIKPGNILLSDDGRTRVFDFGIARTTGSAGLTEIATVIGTAAYLSPEQAAGEPAGPQSDLYSLGCVLDEMLTGAPPFTAETPVALLHRHVHDEPAPPSAHRPEVGPALDAAVLHLLAKDPADRPTDAAAARREVLAALDTVASPTLMLPAIETSADASADAGRRRVPVLALAAAAAVVVLAVVLALLLGRDARDPATATRTPAPAVSSTTPSPSPLTPSASATPSLAVGDAATSAAALDVVRGVIAAGRARGLIDTSAATQLLRATGDVASSVDKKKGKSAVPRIQGLADLVDQLAAAGQVTPPAVTALHVAIDQLRGLVDRKG